MITISNESDISAIDDLSACVLRNKVECAICGIAQLSSTYVERFKRCHIMQYFAFRILDPGSCQYYFTPSSLSLDTEARHRHKYPDVF